MLTRVFLGSLCLANVVHADPLIDSPAKPTSDSTAESTPDPTEVVESMSADEIGGVTLRPIAGPRLEALLSAGNYGSYRALGRATTTRGRLGLELDGGLVESDGFVPVSEADRGAVDRRASLSGRVAGARVEHTTDLDRARAFARYSQEERNAGADHQSSDAWVARYGGRWTHSGTAAHLDLHVFGELQRIHDEMPRIAADRSSAVSASVHAIPLTTHGARGTLTSRQIHAFGLGHDLVIGGGLLLASGEQDETLTPSLDMPAHMAMASRFVRGDHRFLDAYIEDTVRFIRTIEVTGGLKIERWSNLGGDSRIAFGLGDPMDDRTPDVSSLLVSPSFGVTGHVTDQVALQARTYRHMRTPTMEELYRPVLLGEALTAANSTLLPEEVWTTEAGPEITWGRFSARAAMFTSSVDNAITSVTTEAPLADGATRQRQNIGRARVRGIDSEASWRPAKAWLATVAYLFADSEITESARFAQLVGTELAQMPRQRGRAQLTFDDPRVATVTGAVRYIGRTYEDDRNTQELGGFALVDATAARKLHGGLSGFVAVENLFDRRYVVGRTGVETLGAPRMFHLGVRIDSDRF